MIIIRLATFAMGTRFEFVLAGDNESHLRAVGEEAIAEIQIWHRRLNYFAPDSLVRRINSLAPSHPVALDQETFDLLKRCVELHDETGGAIDITIAPLMRRWGFRATAPPPGRGGQDWGTRFIDLNESCCTIRFTRPFIEIDLGAIAKGFALDRAASILREHNITCALLHGGTSSVLAIGAPAAEDGWRVRIAGSMDTYSLPVAPFERKAQFTGTPSDCTSHADSGFDVCLRDNALSISAPHGRTIEHHGELLGHIIDPRTGAPARGAHLAAVICDSATEAEAWSTALLVLNGRPETMLNDVTSILYDELHGWRIGGVTTQGLFQPVAQAEHLRLSFVCLV